MGGWPAFWVAALALLAWTFYLDICHDVDRRLARWWVARAETWGTLTGGRSFLLSTVALVTFCGLAVLADRVAEGAGSPLWALVATGPAMVAYAPFVMATVPAQYNGYWLWRQELARAGADVAQQRAIAWWAGPPSLGGMIAILLAIWSAFVS